MNTYINKDYANFQDFGFEKPQMGIYWKSLDELDIYTNNQVRTLRGQEAITVSNLLRDMHVTIETVE